MAMKPPTKILMSQIEFPRPLKKLLEESDLQAPIRGLADRVGEILADNKLPFFPDYTDHGVTHINDVLKTEVELVPKMVWENSKKDSDPRLLCDADAAVIIGATLLHDIAMHLRVDGFRELVSKGSRFQTLPWFRDPREGHSGDQPWHDLWDDFMREARRFSDRQLGDIVGEMSARSWKFDGLPEDAGRWELNHFLIVGEFIRRHHARLAHEIAIYGFPGLPIGSGKGQFPAMGQQKGHDLKRLADLIGLTARSHGTSLRVCKAYLDASPDYLGTPTPMGTAVLYPMALLRVADYLQIDHQRAPAVLLQLRNPQSPISVQEWNKHLAVQQIGPANDPRGKMVTVRTDLGLSLYLQLSDLLNGLQSEMDHSTAVLDEAYGTFTQLGLHQLNLATRRIYSNLQSPAFRDSLPYVPNRTGFTSDPNLLTLLVEPLYGKRPNVGVRELMQNAVDAVRELETWCLAHEVPVTSLDLPEQDGDVLIEFIKRDDGAWFLRVRDKGIGMKASTIENYFLRAGASFRRSAEWAKEFLDDKGKPRVIRSGRFGVGAFAVFLLGPTFRLWTRHAGAEKSKGYMIEASINNQLIEIKRVSNLLVGTLIEAELSKDSVKALGLKGKSFMLHDGIQRQTDWYCWEWPKVVKRVIGGDISGGLAQEHISPSKDCDLPTDWFAIYPNGFDVVFWSFANQPTLLCNGLKIANPEYSFLLGCDVPWRQELQLRSPCISVLDSAGNLPLTTQRYELSDSVLSFQAELERDTLLSFLAHALICGPTTQLEAISMHGLHPLCPQPISKYSGADAPFTNGLLRWCATRDGMVPVDPWLFAQLHSSSCLIYGAIFDGQNTVRRPAEQLCNVELLEQVVTSSQAVLPWFGVLDSYATDRNAIEDMVKRFPEHFFGSMVNDGVTTLGQPLGIHLVLEDRDEFPLKSDDWSLEDEDEDEDEKKPIWSQVKVSKRWRSLFEVHAGSPIANSSLQSILSAMNFPFKSEHILFAAEYKTAPVDSPESPIAMVWNECFGSIPIPFDPVAREALIAQGCKHTELKRHIEAWQSMKRAGSKWVNGG